MYTIGIVESLRRADRNIQGTVAGCIQYKTDAAHIGHHIGSAVRKEGKRYTGDGHQAQGHCNVFQNMEEKHAHYTDNDETPELVARIPGQVQHTQQDQDICDQDGDAPGKSPGFADRRVDKVCPVSRYIVQLGNCPLDEHTIAGDSSRSDGHLGHGLLISIALAYSKLKSRLTSSISASQTLISYTR